tara:strand:- start:44 stop:247 length:204 start_codon:yes stop_codon:yes gene_type:complete
MANNIKMITIVVLGIIALYFFNMKNSDHNINRSISACIVAQKKTLKSFDLEKSKSYCEKKVKKMVKD